MIFIIGSILVLGVIVFNAYLSSESSLDFRLEFFYNHPQEEVATIMWIILGIGVFLIIVGIIKHFVSKKKIKGENKEKNKLKILKNKKVVIAISALIIIVLLFIFMSIIIFNSKRTRNYNQFNEEEYIVPQKEPTVDLSKYKSHGSFTEDGIAWACTEDYTGHKCGYINTKGDTIIPFKDNLIDIDGNSLSEKYDDYKNGVVLVAEKIKNNGDIMVSAYDTSGNIITSINQKNSTFFSVNHYNGINNVMFTISNLSACGDEKYIYNYNNKEMKKFDVSCTRMFANDFSDGLLYSRDSTSDYNIIFYDKDFNEALKIIVDDNENYESLPEVSDFKNGNATLLFIGKDRNKYTVTIDKKGKWLDEPKKYEETYEDFRDDISY